MQFVDEDVYLSVSELNTDENVTIHCGNLGQELDELRIVLTPVEIIRLANWLNDSVKQLK